MIVRVVLLLSMILLGGWCLDVLCCSYDIFESINTTLLGF